MTNSLEHGIYKKPHPKSFHPTTLFTPRRFSKHTAFHATTLFKPLRWSTDHQVTLLGGSQSYLALGMPAVAK